MIHASRNPTRRAMLRGSLAAVALGAAGSARADNAADVTVAVSSTSFVLAGVKIAIGAGLFARHGVNPRIVVMDSGNAAMAALISGSSQFAVAGPGEMLAARARRQSVVVVANLYRGLAGSMVLAKSVAEKSGISPSAPLADRLRALEGLLIAEPSATSALLVPVRAAATQAGVKVRFVYMAQPAMLSALESGAVHAMMASSPFWGAGVLKGTGVLWINGPGSELPAAVSPTSSSCIQATETFAQANRDLLGRIQAALADLARFIKDDPAEAKRQLAKAYPQLEPAAIDLAFSKEADSWTQPKFSVDDMRHELDLFKTNNPSIAGLDAIDVGALLKFQN
jgi:ABC-type nitrate/sulfonate/bicarbonate transport system substrate-binding protein